MASNPIGTGTENVTANLPAELAKRLGDLAKRSGISRSRYIRILCEEAIRIGRTFEISESVLVKETTSKR